MFSFVLCYLVWCVLVNIGFLVIILVQKLHSVLREANMLPFMEQTKAAPAPAATSTDAPPSSSGSQVVETTVTILNLLYVRN